MKEVLITNFANNEIDIIYNGDFLYNGDWKDFSMFHLTSLIRNLGFIVIEKIEEESKMSELKQQPVSEESVIKKLVELNDQLQVLYGHYGKREIPTVEVQLLIDNILKGKPDWNNISFIEKHTRGK